MRRLLRASVTPIVGAVLVLTTHVSAHGAVLLQVTAGTGADNESEISTLANSMITASQAGGFAEASTEGILRTRATRDGEGLAAGTDGIAVFSSDFQLLGGQAGVAVPLFANFHVSGSLTAIGGPAGIGISQVAFVGSNIFTGASWAGTAQLADTLAGFELTTSGLFAEPGRFTPPEATTASIDTLFSVSLGDVIDMGSIGFTLSSSAVASVAGSADSNFSDSLVLESISVPADFNQVDVSALRVVFDSGLILGVTQAVVPEPSSLTLAGVAGVVGLIYAWRCRRTAA